MKVKIRTNIDPWTNDKVPLEKNVDYEVDEVVIHGWSTDVYLEGFEEAFNSAIFDSAFQKAFEDAIEWFDENPDYRYYGCFIKDYY